MENKNKDTYELLEEEYAPIMHIGEHNRDASEKIKGFIYQDIISINILLNSKKEDKIYIEWCEDIFVENKKNISIYQVKYYPKSYISNKKEIYKNLFYQYLKYKLYEVEEDEKEVNTYLLYYSKNMPIDKELGFNSYDIKNNDFDKIDKKDIKDKLCDIGKKTSEEKNKEETKDKKTLMVKRQELLFEEIASDALVSSFNYEFVERDEIDLEKYNIKVALYNEFIKDDKEAGEKFPHYNNEQIENILFAVSIEYIQSSYYKKTEDDYKERAIQRDGFLEHINKVIGPDKEKQNTRITYALLSFIEEAYKEWIKDIDDEKIEVIEYYEEIYFSTKNFIKEKMKKPEHRRRLYNSLGDKRELYVEELDLTEEQYLVYEFKDRIYSALNIIWKVMFDIEEKDFSFLINEEKEYYALAFADEDDKKIVIIPNIGSAMTQANNHFQKYFKVGNKPSKWYFKNELYRGDFEYSQKVNDIKEAYINDYHKSYKVNNIEKKQIFFIDCLDCIDIDYHRCEKDNTDYMFSPNCKKGVR